MFAQDFGSQILLCVLRGSPDWQPIPLLWICRSHPVHSYSLLVSKTATISQGFVTWQKPLPFLSWFYLTVFLRALLGEQKGFHAVKVPILTMSKEKSTKEKPQCDGAALRAVLFKIFWCSHCAHARHTCAHTRTTYWRHVMHKPCWSQADLGSG